MHEDKKGRKKLTVIAIDKVQNKAGKGVLSDHQGMTAHPLKGTAC